MSADHELHLDAQRSLHPLGLRDAPVTPDYGGEKAKLALIQPEVSLREGVQGFGVHPDIAAAVREVLASDSFIESLTSYEVGIDPAIKNLRDYYEISNEAGVFLSSTGSNGIINKLPDLLPPPPAKSQIFIVGPAFQNIISAAEKFRKDQDQEEWDMMVGVIDGYPRGLDATYDEILDYSINRRKLRSQTRPLLWYLCVPSTPKGETVSLEVVERLISLAEEKGDTVAIDTAFKKMGTLVQLVDKYSNLIFTGSTSKIVGLPGLRLGWAIASPEVARKYEKIVQLNEISAPIGLIANKILDPKLLNENEKYVEEKTLEVKPVLAQALKDAGFHIYPTDMSVPSMLVDGGSQDFVSRLNRVDVDVVSGAGYSLTFRSLENGFGGIREGISDRHARIIVPSSVEEIPEIVRRFVVARDNLSPSYL